MFSTIITLAFYVSLAIYAFTKNPVALFIVGVTAVILAILTPRKINMQNIMWMYRTGGARATVFYVLQKTRISIFWDKEMRRREYVNPILRKIGSMIMRLQDSKKLFPVKK